MIYKYSLGRIPKQEAQELFKHYTMFEKRFGDRRGIEDVIVSKRRFQYEEEVKVGSPQFSGRLLKRSSSLTPPPRLSRQTPTTTTPGSTICAWWRTTPSPRR